MKIDKCIKTLLLSLVVMPFCTGCDNETNSSPINGDYDGSTVMVTVGDVINANERVETRATHAKEIFTQPLDKNKDTGLDVETTIESIEPVQTRAVVPLEMTKFRLVAYKSGEVSPANYAGQGDFQTDEKGMTTAIAGHELFLPEGLYTFVCYSYRNMEDIPVFDGSETSVPVKSGDEFMTFTKTGVNVKADASGVFTLRDVVFVHHSALVQIEVSAAGYPEDSKISQCEAVIQNMNGAARWTMGTVDSKNLEGENESVPFTWNDLDADVVTSEQVKVLSFENKNISLIFSKLTIGGVHFDNTEVVLPMKQLAPAGNYKITIRLTRNFIEVGGYKWAKGNVYTEGAKFYIEASQQAYHKGQDGGSYFSWNTLSVDPNSYNRGEYSTEKDPCYQIEPKGTWQTPSRDEYYALIQAGFEFDEADKGGWYGGKSTGVFLPATGIRFLNISGTIDLVLEDEVAFYGTRIGVTSNQKCNYLQLESYGTLVTDGEYKSTGMPIRCVKINNE